MTITDITVRILAIFLGGPIYLSSAFWSLRQFAKIFASTVSWTLRIYNIQAWLQIIINPSPALFNSSNPECFGPDDSQRLECKTQKLGGKKH